jgi:hypothetical protein
MIEMTGLLQKSDIGYEKPMLGKKMLIQTPNNIYINKWKETIRWQKQKK